jgi:hypothetical protein
VRVRVDDAVEVAVVEHRARDLAGGVERELGVRLAVACGLEGDGRALGRERLGAQQEVVSSVAQLILRPVDHGGLERPLGAGDIGVVDQRDIGVELGLAEQRAVVGDQVAAVLVVEQVGAEVGGPHDEARGAGLVGAEREGGGAAGGQVDVPAAQREATVGEAVGVELRRLAGGAGHAGHAGGRDPGRGLGAGALAGVRGLGVPGRVAGGGIRGAADDESSKGEWDEVGGAHGGRLYPKRVAGRSENARPGRGGDRRRSRRAGMTMVSLRAPSTPAPAPAPLRSPELIHVLENFLGRPLDGAVFGAYILRPRRQS